MIDADEISRLQDEWTRRWHMADEELEAEGGSVLIRQNHRANFDLWHEEDRARDPEATDGEIARVKRTIDGLNQRRNDLVEALDQELLTAAVTGMEASAPLHSETPGMMMDRLSILALKIFHTREQMERPEVSEAHRQRSAERLRVLEEQRRDLRECLGALWSEVQGGRRRFKIYRQMKMYNDPELNPAIYKGRKP